MRFTPRQRDVAAQIALGKQTKEIARDLGISIGTVKCHTMAVLAATGARNRTEAAIKLRAA